jgi:hypothetical protein
MDFKNIDSEPDAARKEELYGPGYVNARASEIISATITDAFAASVDSMIREYAEDFADQHEKWLAEQERQASKYTWIPARELTGRDVICERGAGRKIFKFHVREIRESRSRFDRHVVVEIDGRKLWRYDGADLVMVLT